MWLHCMMERGAALAWAGMTSTGTNTHRSFASERNWTGSTCVPSMMMTLPCERAVTRATERKKKLQQHARHLFQALVQIALEPLPDHAALALERF